jgi:secreted PhoX family phosphatase
MPLVSTDLTPAEQLKTYQRFTVQDDVVLPKGYTYQVLASWGDRLGNSRVGYNNDYLSLIETSNQSGYLTVNFEYISAKPWLQTYEQVIGQSLPLQTVIAAAREAGKQGINAYALTDGDPLKQQIQRIATEAMVDLGIGVMEVRRNQQGRWLRSPGTADRRVTGISGLADGHFLRATGPALAVFRRTEGQGYRDAWGERIVGTFANCAGGTTPWGTVLSAEENFQTYVPEAVFADGSAMDPSHRPFTIDNEELAGMGNVFGLAGNKYGWMVEIDPANPQDYGTKHTWLGRFRHEAVAMRVQAGHPLAVYSGCDRRGGHVYKFVSREPVRNPTDPTNSRLFAAGMLYVARFEADGTGRWIPLKASTPVDPNLPSQHAGGMVTLPNRPGGGSQAVREDGAIARFKETFKTLGDLYTGSPEAQQGSILIDAHLAATAVGGTCTARPEDTDIGPNGALFITFTSGAPSRSDGGPDNRIFQGPKGEPGYEFGWIMRLDENQQAPEAMSFRWTMFSTGGEPASGGVGFANPDNLAFDVKGNLWMVTDMSSDKLNQEVLSRTQIQDGQPQPISSSNLRGIFGNNSIWLLPTQGPQAGQAFLFGFGPMDAELTGPWFSQDQRTLFLSAQHPGEVMGIRQEMAMEQRRYLMQTTDGQPFLQERSVPLGSNWPGKGKTDPPKPSIITIYRQDGAPLV